MFEKKNVKKEIYLFFFSLCKLKWMMSFVM